MSPPRQQPLLAFFVALAAVAALSLMDGVMKGLVIDIGLYATALWRALAGAIMAALLFLPRRARWPSRSVLLRIHVARAVLVTVMGLLFFWGLGRTPMAQAIALTFIAPLIALFLAALLLGERIGPRSIGGSFLAFFGVIVIFVGQARAELGREALLGGLAILASALCYAVNIVMMRRQSLAARPLEIAFFQNITVAALLWASAPILGLPPLPQISVAPILIVALLSLAGVLLFAFAYARGEAGYLAVTEYSGFLWAALFGWLLFGERVSPYTVAGAVLIIAGCLWASRPKSKAPVPQMEIAA